MALLGSTTSLILCKRQNTGKMLLVAAGQKVGGRGMGVDLSAHFK